MTTTYIPGVCNIGPAEIKTRRMTGIVGVIITVLFLAGSLVLAFPPVLRLIVILPAGLAASGFLQAAFHFCVQFGTRGLFNVSDSLGKVESVDQAEYRKKDQQKALKIIGYSGLIAAIVAVIAFFFV
jgi:hypothetical protein